MLFDHIEEKEAVEKAALIEKNSAPTHPSDGFPDSLLMEKIPDKKIKAVFRTLIKDEKRHLKTIEKKYFPEAGFKEYEITEEEIEVENYVKKLGVPDIFARKINMEKLVRLLDEPKKALLIALDAELHSAQYFKDLSEKAMSEDGRKIYLELADEESIHVSRIQGLIRDYSG